VSESSKINKRVLSVGQCYADQYTITRFLRDTFGAEVIAADSTRQALDQARRETFTLILVNRVFDADGSSGLEFIQTVKADEQLRAVPIMLVSNYDDAQAQAVQAGAVHGFGKAALSHPQTMARLEPHLR
jgi:CheY-like chemotaxis protein